MAVNALVPIPPNATRAERRAILRAAANAERASAPVTQKRTGDALPEAAVAGPFGPGLVNGGYWNLQRPRLAPHETTSNHLAGIYPFVADAGLGHQGPVVGVDLNADSLWHFSPWHAYANNTDRGTFSTNILVLGAYRAGKSGTIKALVTRSLAFGHQAVVPSDSKGEWVEVAEAVGGNVIRLGGGLPTRLNPLARGPRRTDVSDARDEEMVKQRRMATLQSLVEQTVKNRALGSAEQGALAIALDRAIEATDDRPTLREVYRHLEDICNGTGVTDQKIIDAASEPRFVLRRFVEGDLSGLFEDESTVDFDEDAPMVVVDTSELFARSELVAQLTSVCTTAWIQAVISDRNAKRNRYLIREEGWRDMTSLAALRMYQQWLKLSRHYGIANVVILHKMTDLDAVGEADSQERALAYSMVGDIENKMIFRVNAQEQANLRTRLNLPAHHLDIARSLRKGVFIGYVGQYSYVVDCFATSTPWEVGLFSTDEAIVNLDDAPDGIDTESLADIWPEDTTSQQDEPEWLEDAAGIAAWLDTINEEAERR